MVLTDIRMPGAGGMEVRRSVARPAPPVVLMTGYGTVERRQAMRIGAAHYAKPFRNEAMVRW